MSLKKLGIFEPIFAASMLLMSPASGWAQQAAASGGAPEKAREHFDRGTVAYSQGDYELAIREWEAAYGLDARPKIKYNVAQAYERLSKLNEAVAALQLYIQTAGSEDNQFLADARVKLAAIQSRIANTGVTIQGGPEGAAISVDGASWGRTPRPDRIALAPGSHRVVISLAGYRDFISDVAIPPGQVINVAVQMTPESQGAAPPAVQAAPSAAAESKPPETGEKKSGSGSVGWFVAAGVLGAGTVASVIWYVDRNSAANECSKPRIGKACLNESKISGERTIALISTAVCGVGAIAASVIGLVMRGGGEEKQPPAAACAPTFTGAVCWTSF